MAMQQFGNAKISKPFILHFKQYNTLYEYTIRIQCTFMNSKLNNVCIFSENVVWDAFSSKMIPRGICLAILQLNFNDIS